MFEIEYVEKLEQLIIKVLGVKIATLSRNEKTGLHKVEKDEELKLNGNNIGKYTTDYKVYKLNQSKLTCSIFDGKNECLLNIVVNTNNNYITFLTYNKKSRWVEVEKIEIPKEILSKLTAEV